MKGYFNDPEGTEQTLKDGWLYTGDMAKKDNEGYFYLVARKKEIIKVRGKRDSPKEIEEVILSVNEVVDCTITGIEDDIVGEAIKANIVISDLEQQEKIREIILNRCVKSLASHKIPQFFQFDDQMKVSSTGKKTHPENPFTYVYLARFHLKEGRLGKSIQNYRRAIEMEPDYVDERTPLFIGDEIGELVVEGREKFGREKALKPKDKEVRRTLKDVYYIQSRLAGGCE